MYKRQGDYEEALGYLDTAQRLDPRNMILYNDRAFDLVALGRYEESIAVLEAALKIEPDNSQILVSRAWYEYIKTGSSRLFEEETRLLPKEGEMLDVWVGFHYIRGEWEQVVALGPLRDVDPVADPAEFIRWNDDQGWAYRLLGDTESARALALKTLPVAEKLAAENPRYWIKVADLYALLGRSEDSFEALERWQKAVSDDKPVASDYYFFLAQYQTLFGDSDEAIRSIDQYLETQRFLSPEFYRVWPVFDSLHDLPEFQSVLEKHSN